MLVSRHIETEPSSWSFSKFEAASHGPPAGSTRMSNQLDTPLSTENDWQNQYSYLQPNSNPHSHAYSHFDRNSGPEASQPRSTVSEPRALEADNKNGHGSPASLSENNANSSTASAPAQPTHPSPLSEQTSQPQLPQQQQDDSGVRSLDQPIDGSQRSDSRPNNASRPAYPTISVPTSSSANSNPISISTIKEEPDTVKDEEEDLFDDEDMEGDAMGLPQTAAERASARRKMKRFRLTHQQTRFLMSEFAKQPHPDAAHRDRLSREIPGLSPRQVQVWFQNRRAKIKRLTADDRERMIKMRAVPDDFDNIQALHSPYGAVQGIHTPLASPAEFGNQAFAEHMMRPLMVDVRRPEGEEHLSTGLSPAFGSLGFNAPSNSMSSPDVLSPLSPSPGDHRYGYPSHFSPGARPTSTFGRQSSFDNSLLHSRQSSRHPQPLHLRDAMTRSRSDNLQSPLRTGMSWKGDAMSYTSYPTGPTSPQVGGRQHSVYQGEHMGPTGTGNAAGGGLGYDPVESPPNINYTSYQPSSLHQSSQNRLRSRAASATLPLGLDLRNQYRPLNTSLHSPGAQTPVNARETSQFSGPSPTNYSTSFPSAPLTAPIDYSMPRTPGPTSSGPGNSSSSGRHGASQDYSMPQMSAPIAPPNDFSQAFQSGVADRGSASNAFGTANDGSRSAVESHLGSDLRSDGQHFGSIADLKRQRSFTMPTTASGQSSQDYRHQA